MASPPVVSKMVYGGKIVKGPHPNTPVLPPPFKVSPFIRFCRWGALGTGILWGVMRNRQIRRKHERIREYEHHVEVAEGIEASKRNALLNKEQMTMLAKEAGLTMDAALAKQLGLEL